MPVIYCEECDVDIADDNGGDVHTQHDLDCYYVTLHQQGLTPTPEDCTCYNMKDVCEQCCNVCNPPTTTTTEETPT